MFSGKESVGSSLSQPISYLPQPNFTTPVFLSQGQQQPLFQQNSHNAGMQQIFSPFTHDNSQSTIITHNIPIDNITEPQNNHLSEHSDGEDSENHYSWQDVRNKRKRKKISSTQADVPIISQSNKYSPLGDVQGNGDSQQNTDNVQGTDGDDTPKQTIPKPPPIFVHGVINYDQMLNTLADIVEENNLTTKCLSNNVVKINVKTTETYRNLVKFMQEKNIIHHTYQLKEEKPYRVVIKHLHPLTPVSDIKEDLENVGFSTRNIINIRQRTTKTPLPMFFVDLEPAENNKNIYNLKYLQNRVIAVEPPKKSTEIVQCTRCQQYNHTKSYCNRPYACVKCGGSHDTKTCQKTRDTPPTCILCNGDHPANYKGCQVYRELQNKYRTGQQQTKRRITEYRQYNEQHTYAQLTKNSAEPNSTNSEITLSKFLNEFKSMFNQLIQQNSMILNMLSSVITKLVK